AERELRARQNPAKRHLDPPLEASCAIALLVEGHEAAAIRVRHRTTVGASGKRRHDLRRTADLGCGIRRMAGEDSSAALRVAGAASVERTGDRQHVDVRTAQMIARVRTA